MTISLGYPSLKNQYLLTCKGFMGHLIQSLVIRLYLTNVRVIKSYPSLRALNQSLIFVQKLDLKLIKIKIDSKMCCLHLT